MDDSGCFDKYFKMPNALQDALCKLRISGTQTQVLAAIIRLTFGWKILEERIANYQIAGLTGLRANHVAREIQSLVNRNIIFAKPGPCHFIKINTEYDDWCFDKINSNPTIRKDRIVVKKEIENKPEVVKRQKKITPEWFKELWKLYPVFRRGGNYQAGWAKWRSMNLTEEDAALAVEWLLGAAKSCPSSWAKDANGFALGFVKFIGQTLWNTPMPAEQKKTGHQTKDFSNIDYADGMDIWNGESDRKYFKERGM